MTLAALVCASVCPWMPLILSEARTREEALTLAAIVHVESRGQPGLVGVEKNGSCSVGLGMVNVPDCDPDKIQSLKDPVTNIRTSAKILRATRSWCATHPRDRHCRAGERVFRGGGAVNRYAGRTSSYAPRVAPVRAALRRACSTGQARCRACRVAKPWQGDRSRAAGRGGR